jgi:hypothetical protein
VRTRSSRVTANFSRSERRAAVAAIFLTALSLWCTWGNTATQLANRFKTKVTATVVLSRAERGRRQDGGDDARHNQRADRSQVRARRVQGYLLST